MAVALIWKKVRQRQSAAGSFYATNSPGLSSYLSRHCEIATGAKRPRNDKLGGIAPMNLCHNRCQPARRSLTAATDAIGLCVFSVARANCKCLPEIATAPLGPRNDKSGGHRRFNGSLYESFVQRRERHAAPLQGACGRRECVGICRLSTGRRGRHPSATHGRRPHRAFQRSFQRSGSS